MRVSLCFALLVFLVSAAPSLADGMCDVMGGKNKCPGTPGNPNVLSFIQLSEQGNTPTVIPPAVGALEPGDLIVRDGGAKGPVGDLVRFGANTALLYSDVDDNDPNDVAPPTTLLPLTFTIQENTTGFTHYQIVDSTKKGPGGKGIDLLISYTVRSDPVESPEPAALRLLVIVLGGFGVYYYFFSRRRIKP